MQHALSDVMGYSSQVPVSSRLSSLDTWCFSFIF